MTTPSATARPRGGAAHETRSARGIAPGRGDLGARLRVGRALAFVLSLTSLRLRAARAGRRGAGLPAPAFGAHDRRRRVVEQPVDGGPERRGDTSRGPRCRPDAGHRLRAASCWDHYPCLTCGKLGPSSYSGCHKRRRLSSSRTMFEALALQGAAPLQVAVALQVAVLLLLSRPPCSTAGSDRIPSARHSRGPTDPRYRWGIRSQFRIPRPRGGREAR